MTDSFAAFKLQDAIEAVTGLQEGVTQPRVMEVYQTMETVLKALQYAVNEGMATRRLYAEEREQRENVQHRLTILEGMVAAKRVASPSTPAYTPPPDAALSSLSAPDAP